MLSGSWLRVQGLRAKAQWTYFYLSNNCLLLGTENILHIIIIIIPF